MSLRMTMTAGAAAFALTLSAAHAASLNETDQEFIEKAAEGGHAEVTLGEEAAKSDNPDVAAFGRQMVEDHGKLNQELASVAKAKGVEPPESADLASQAKGVVLDVLPGKTFDSQYVSSQLDDHKETLDLFQKEAREGQDPELKAVAEKGIPVIQQHIAELESLQKKPELQ